MQRTVVALLLALWATAAMAMQPFRVSDIRVEGLQRIAAGTVFNYLPIQVGDRVDEGRIADAIRSLYDTGFFQDIAIGRDGDVLVVKLTERPAVARIDLEGNDKISDENLLKGLRDAGLAEGRTFNRSLLDKIERSLKQQYYSLGLYDVDVKSTVSPLPRNRVSVRLDIDEGEPASVRHVQFVGNKAFDDETLRDQFKMGPISWWNFFSSADKYSRQKLAGDLETLRSYYQDRGFINFTITSTQVSISPDRQSIDITVNLNEGEQYHVGKVSLSGDLVFAKSQMQKLITLKKGGLYAQKDVTDTSDALRQKLGEAGYAFANVNAVPDVNKKDHTVDLTFFVDPAERVYVRHINISGNERTRDEVIRRELTQPEGGWLSTDKVKKSKDKLGRLGFFKDVSVETPRVPGTNDQVDLNVDVKERLSGSVQAGVGYGTQNGVLVNFGVQQDNVLGSGDKLAFNANNDRINTVYRLSYLDRYYTKEGIDRNMSIAYRNTDASQANLASYGITSLTGTYGYNIPIDEEDTVGADLEYEDLTLNLTSDPTRIQQDFVDTYGEQNRILRMNLSWTRDSRDRAIFATRGARQSLSTNIAVPGIDLQYYKVSYSQKRYFSLNDWLTLSVDGSLAYGDGYGSTNELPFFENFYAGGISSVRGFRGNSLGPRDENNDPVGGNARALGSMELLFPPTFGAGSEKDGDSGGMRLGTFIDAGQVWNTNNQQVGTNVRYSAGLAFIWYSPLGPLTMSVARPLTKSANDDTQFFQFSLGGVF